MNTVNSCFISHNASSSIAIRIVSPKHDGLIEIRNYILRLLEQVADENSNNNNTNNNNNT